MDEYHEVPGGDGRELLTLMEAATLLRIGRATAYALAREFLRTSGASGLPVIRVGKQLRVCRERLDDVIQRGTTVVGELTVPAEDQRKTRRRRTADDSDVLQLFPR